MGPGGNIYVSASDQVVVFAPDGTLVNSWGSGCSGPSQFEFPLGIAAGPDGSVYVADTRNHRVQKFDENGNFERQWGSEGTGESQFNSDAPSGVAVSTDNIVYVTDQYTGRIEKFDAAGEYLGEWSSPAWGIDVAQDGTVFGAEQWDDRVRRYNPDTGAVLDEWGSTGSGPGQFKNPRDIVISGSSEVFVADETQQDQRFTPVTAVEDVRAIVVAAGGSYPGNDLWNATQVAANFAYRTLVSQGFTNESITYLFLQLTAGPGQQRYP